MLKASYFFRKWSIPSRLAGSPKSRHQYCRYARAVEAYNEPNVDSHVNGEYASCNWDELGFGLTPTDYMYIMNCTSKDQNFSQGTLARFGKLEMNPASGILNYGQGLFEGLKAYRIENGRILLFRPEENAMRMKMGAKRMCMPSPTVQQFVNAVKQTVHSNKRWVSASPGKGSMYVRPLLMGTGPGLGVGPASEYTLITYASPVGNYHKGLLNFVVEENFRRATPGGTGGVKAITNYATIYKPIAEAKAKGFTDVLFLDAVAGKYIEEASTSNIFLVKGNVISTPPTHGTILPGITRKSIIEIARVLGYQVEERAILVEEMFEAEEVFCTGTAVVVSSVSSVTYQGKRIEYKRGEGTVGQKLYEMLTGIQTGRIEDKMGWTVEL